MYSYEVKSISSQVNFQVVKVVSTLESAALLGSGCNVILTHPVSQCASDEDAVVFLNHKYNQKLYIFVSWQPLDGRRS